MVSNVAFEFHDWSSIPIVWQITDGSLGKTSTLYHSLDGDGLFLD